MLENFIALTYAESATPAIGALFGITVTTVVATELCT